MILHCLQLNPALTNMRSDLYQPIGSLHSDVWLDCGSQRTPIDQRVCVCVCVG